jgi:membrane protein implicated in regulation of membrane protease activity
MIYLVAIFVPPLYFLINKKWLALIGSMVAFFFAVIFAIMMILLPLSLILWAICSVVAVWDLRKRVMHENADVLATKMAEKMREAQTTPPVMPKK